MTRYVRTNYVPVRCRYLLSVGTLYKTLDEGLYSRIKDDTGDTILIFLPTCPYLDDKPWEVVEIDEKEPQGCPHGDLRLEYIKDCQKYEKPWLNWEFSKDGIMWEDFPNYYGYLVWSTDRQHRRKPSTININGFEVPEPLREAPEEGTVVYLPSTYYENCYAEWYWQHKIPISSKLLTRGVVHLTKEAAILHAKALLSFTEVPNVNN